MISQAEWTEWKQHPTTIEFFRFLTHVREELKEGLAEGAGTGHSIDESAQLSAKYIGQCQLLKDLDELTYEEMIKEIYGE